MSKAYICQGNYASSPLYVESFGIRIYCVEELCWFLKENAHLLDESIFARPLAEWLEKECGLPDLALKLRVMMKKEDAPGELVRLLMEETGYCDPAQIRQMQKLITVSADMTLPEKQKARGDLYLDSRKFIAAAQTYRGILRDNDRLPAEFAGKVWCNLGSALAGMFYFRQAADAFEKAWELLRAEDALMMHLQALRMCLADADYLNYVTGHPEYYNASLRVEKRMSARKAAWTDSRNDSVIASMKAALFMEDDEACDRLMREERARLEDEYRNCAG